MNTAMINDAVRDKTYFTGEERCKAANSKHVLMPPKDLTNDDETIVFMFSLSVSLQLDEVMRLSPTECRLLPLFGTSEDSRFEIVEQFSFHRFWTRRFTEKAY